MQRVNAHRDLRTQVLPTGRRRSTGCPWGAQACRHTRTQCGLAPVQAPPRGRHRSPPSPPNHIGRSLPSAAADESHRRGPRDDFAASYRDPQIVQTFGICLTIARGESTPESTPNPVERCPTPASSPRRRRTHRRPGREAPSRGRHRTMPGRRVRSGRADHGERLGVPAISPCGSSACTPLVDSSCTATEAASDRSGNVAAYAYAPHRNSSPGEATE
jgi:hypothetical protein